MDSVNKQERQNIEARVQEFASKWQYPMDITLAQRTMGPRLNAVVPPQGSEIVVTQLPPEVFEDELVPLFQTAGGIYKFRLLMNPTGASNMGTAYVTYDLSADAGAAINTFNGMALGPDGSNVINVKQSNDNRRIFVGGIPENKNKDQVWQELIRIGLKGIVEVIMYRSYIDRNRNRGFVFVEFSTHEEAAFVRETFKHAFIFGNRVQIDWSSAMSSADDTAMKTVRKLFVRHLNVLQERYELENLIYDVLGTDQTVEKVYKFRDYAFIHFSSRRDAQRALSLLRDHYRYTDVEVTWAKPANRKCNYNSSYESRSASTSPESSSAQSSPTKSATPFNINAQPWTPLRDNNLMPMPSFQPYYCYNCLQKLSNDDLLLRNVEVMLGNLDIH